jgi:site-specific recombinase XerD
LNARFAILKEFFTFIFLRQTDRLPAITYHIIHHRNQSRILVKFPPDTRLNERIKKVPGALWSASHKGWHIPDTPENREKCGLVNKLPVTVAASLHLSPRAKSQQLSENNRKQLLRFTEKLVLKKYSNSTLKTYCNEFMQLLLLLDQKNVQDLTAEQLKSYMLYCTVKLKLSENTLHSRLNALKFYFEQVLKRDKIFWEIPRPKKALQLPKLLNETELARLFNALSNKKHKAMLFTVYSAGLRLSELVNLKLADVDSKRMLLFIERAKGKKDRYVNLSPVLLDILRDYIKSYTPRPQYYLFESEQTLTAYPARTVQQIFTNAKQKAGIRKEVGIHSLRHSFATHLLEKGTDIKYIKDLLGHFNIKTTERYLHVSRKLLVNISSPLDDLVKKENISW